MKYHGLSVVFQWVLISLACYRVTRFVTSDSFPLPRNFRNFVDRKYGPDHWFADLISCNWCFGTWVIAATYLAICLFHLISVPLPLLQAFATGTVVGFIGNYDG